MISSYEVIFDDFSSKINLFRKTNVNKNNIIAYKKYAYKRKMLKNAIVCEKKKRKMFSLNSYWCNRNVSLTRRFFGLFGKTTRAHDDLPGPKPTANEHYVARTKYTSGGEEGGKHYRPVGVLGQTVGHDRARRAAADHHEIVLVLDLGHLPVHPQPAVRVLDVRAEEQYGHADEQYVTDAGPVRHGDAGGQPGRERAGRHARPGRRRPRDDALGGRGGCRFARFGVGRRGETVGRVPGGPGERRHRLVRSSRSTAIDNDNIISLSRYRFIDRLTSEDQADRARTMKKNIITLQHCARSRADAFVSRD